MLANRTDMNSLHFRAIMITVTILFFFFSGCLGGDSIGDILQKTDEYEGRTVNIQGEVVEELSFPLLSQGAYKIEDGTGSIWVITTKGTPSKGKEVSVKGTVRIAFRSGETNLGTVILEEVRK